MSFVLLGSVLRRRPHSLHRRPFCRHHQLNGCTEGLVEPRGKSHLGRSHLHQLGLGDVHERSRQVAIMRDILLHG